MKTRRSSSQWIAMSRGWRWNTTRGDFAWHLPSSSAALVGCLNIVAVAVARLRGTTQTVARLLYVSNNLLLLRRRQKIPMNHSIEENNLWTTFSICNISDMPDHEILAVNVLSGTVPSQQWKRKPSRPRYTGFIKSMQTSISQPRCQ